MNLQLLIDSIMRQTTVLIANLATSGGERAPLAHVATTELDTMTGGGPGLDELVWALVYREGPLTRRDLERRSFAPAENLDATLSKLVASGRVTVSDDPVCSRYSSSQLFIPLGAPAGWEAALFDHFSAMVKTMVGRLGSPGADSGATTGGSTYTFDIWEGHPHEAEILGILQRFRAECSQLREKMSEHNRGAQPPADPTRVTVYAGQCVIEGGAAAAGSERIPTAQENPSAR